MQANEVQAFESVSNSGSSGKVESHCWRLTDDAVLNGVEPTTRFRNPPRCRLARGGEAAQVRAAAGKKGGEATSAAVKRRHRHDLSRRSRRVIKPQPEDPDSGINAIPSPGTDSLNQSGPMQPGPVISSQQDNVVLHRSAGMPCGVDAMTFSNSSTATNASPTSMQSGFEPQSTVEQPGGMNAMLPGMDYRSLNYVLRAAEQQNPWQLHGYMLPATTHLASFGIISDTLPCGPPLDDDHHPSDPMIWLNDGIEEPHPDLELEC